MNVLDRSEATHVNVEIRDASRDDDLTIERRLFLSEGRARKIPEDEDKNGP